MLDPACQPVYLQCCKTKLCIQAQLGYGIRLHLYPPYLFHSYLRKEPALNRETLEAAQKADQALASGETGPKDSIPSVEPAAIPSSGDTAEAFQTYHENMLRILEEQKNAMLRHLGEEP